jgi:uncharacterized phage-associated protein
MMLIPFHVEKVAQAAAVLLKTEENRRMSRLRLLKLLYVADRERLQESGRPITGDRVAAMDHGPVLSQTYNLIKGEDLLTPQWERYIRRVNHRYVVLDEDPGVGKLTRKEIAKLNEVATRYEDWDDYQVAVYTHSFPEWEKNKPAAGSSNRIPLEDLIEATGLSHIKDQLIANAANERLVDQLINDAAISG